MQGTGTLIGNQGTMEAYIKSNPEKYGHLVDEDSKHTIRNDVWIVDISKEERKGFLTTGYGTHKKLIGPEYAFGFTIGDYYKDPVLIVKSAWGGKSLHTDFLSPSSQEYPTPKAPGDTGFYYAEILRHISEITQNLSKYCPIYQGTEHEIVGFGWHQGWNDRIKQQAVDTYEKNMENFIKDIRVALDIPNLPFVIANTGIEGWDQHPRYKARSEKLMEAQLALGDPVKYPAFKGTVSGVETRDFWREADESPSKKQGYHWNRNWETFYLIGESMGNAMQSLLSSPQSIPTIQPSQSNPYIDAVFLAQTHVNKPDDPYFKLTGNRPALLKVHVLSPTAEPAPKVYAKVSVEKHSTEFILSGPSQLPKSLPSEPGKVQHQLSDSFSTMIPANWVRKGMHIDIFAGKNQVSHKIKVGAPSKITMRMFDIHYFGKKSRHDYPETFFKELEAKWPVSEFTVQRIRNINFHEMVIPARPDVGTPHVRIKSKEDYLEKTGKRFDGEQSAALQWVHALSASGGHFDTAMCYVNISGVPSGGQAGSFDGVGQIGSLGITSHELGHAFGLPHWGRSKDYPYRGDMYGITAPRQEVHVGPTWGFDLPSQTFISPIFQTKNRDVSQNLTPANVYKNDPMQGGGQGMQEPPFLINHFSDYSVYRMQAYIEKKLAVLIDNEYYKWNQKTGAYSIQVSNKVNRGIHYPLTTEVDVISVMAACTLADKSVNMIYPPIGPYNGNLMMTFDPQIPSQRKQAKEQNFSPQDGCDFSLRIIQGDKESIYMLPASGAEGADPLKGSSLKTVAVNLPAQNGEVTKVELLLTPDAETKGLPNKPEVLYAWNK